MTIRFASWGLLLAALGALVVGGCEPYMSMTDPMSAEDRRAATLLPEQPRFVGMMDVQTVLERLEASNRLDVDSLRQTDDERLRAFLEATGLDLREDLHAVYGAVESSESFSVLVKGNLSPEQVQRYLDQTTDAHSRAGKYRDIPVFHLTPGETESDAPSDTLTVGFLEEGWMAVALERQRVRDMVDRHRDQSTSLADNEEYMRLMRQVGSGSTAWLMGRDVFKTALQDTVDAGTTATVNRAGVQKALLNWSNRVLGLSEVPDVSEMGSGTEEKLERLQQRIREQAISLTWTESAVDGQIFLTMRDEASASSVVKVAEGAMAAFRLSGDNLTERQRALLDDVTIEKEGAFVRVEFSVDQELLGPGMKAGRLERNVHREKVTTRRSLASVRRLPGINLSSPALRSVQSRGMQPTNE